MVGTPGNFSKSLGSPVDALLFGEYNIFPFFMVLRMSIQTKMLLQVGLNLHSSCNSSLKISVWSKTSQKNRADFFFFSFYFD